jgi:hypothetical protein
MYTTDIAMMAHGSMIHDSSLLLALSEAIPQISTKKGGTTNPSRIKNTDKRRGLKLPAASSEITDAANGEIKSAASPNPAIQVLSIRCKKSLSSVLTLDKDEFHDLPGLLVG